MPVAICDVDDNNAATVAKAHAQAKVYRDFRKMLESRHDIDAVMVATPDHNHAQIIHSLRCLAGRGC